MNYAQLYTSAKKAIVESLISLWVPAKSDVQKYLQRLLTDEEPLIAEPVFQSIFPWESSNHTFAEHSSVLRLLDDNFVSALSNSAICNEYTFPRERFPYKHQTSCWQGMLASKPKTMVVTSGTGSGKTECFMIPVLQDIMRRNEKNAVQAIFLYPLNALMKSQQQRMDAWCKAIPGEVTYAIYNGDTEEKIPQSKIEDYFPQLCSRQQIRQTPPQVLFTNPTMLNYMLVRKEDKPILEQSKGKLRWILLDEAHSYTGSSAAELALQLRRVLDAFDVTLDQVNFAVTSATVGDPNDIGAQDKLRSFVSQLTGKPKDDIVIIGGQRVIPQLDVYVAKQKIDEINQIFGTKISIKDINNIRKSLNDASVLTLNSIVSQLVSSKKRLSTETSLSLLDKLGEVCDNLCGESLHSALLPTRAHFFIRAISGVYVCPNHECDRHKDFRINIGNLTTNQSLVCPSCKSRMLEVTTCRSCGGLILYGEDSTTGGYRMRQHIVNLDDDLFGTQETAALENDIEDSTTNNSVRERDSWVPIFLAKPTQPCLRANAHSESFKFDCKNNRLVLLENNNEAGYKSMTRNDGTPLCPHCGNLVDNVDHLRASANLMGRTITPLLLDNAEPTNATDVDVVYEGRKFISFTDSRQGTAKSALSINQDVERNWTRSAIFHRLADIRLEGMSNNATLTAEETQKLEAYRMLGDALPPILMEDKKSLEQKERGVVEVPVTTSIKWADIRNNLENDACFRKLYQHLRDTRVKDAKKDITYMQAQDYLAALFLDQFGWIPKRANSLENMGLVRLSYPTLKQAVCPDSLLREGLTDADWRDFLKICLDYVIRGGRHYTIASNYAAYLSQNRITSYIYPSKCDLKRNGQPVSKWPTLQERKNHTIKDSQHRIILLLCAAMGIPDADLMSDEQKATIEDALNKAWDFITQKVLTVYDTENKGYALDLLGDKVELQLFDYGWLCPVDSVIVDTVFKGYSPRMTGFISSHTFDRYRVGEKINIPHYPYRSDNIYDSNIDEWIEKELAKHQALGIINTPLKSVYYNRPIYIAAEHSAQQDRGDLERYEKDFTNGKLNILSCSTTMEMGVDIGGVSEVVMNNVPPKSANYLQRAGRAGRRNETKTLALTFCPTTPIGSNTWHNPTWPMTHLTEMPLIKMESRQLIQRHVNAFFFTSFINGDDMGMSITERLVDFFGEEKDTYNRFLDYLSDISNGHNTPTPLILSYSNLVHSTGMQHMAIESAALHSKFEIGRVQSIYSKRLEALNKVIEDAQDVSSKMSARSFIERQRDNFLRQNLLSYLAEQNFLPSAGIPTGLVECTLDNADKSPSMHLSQAISAYAPGTQVIKNEWCYEPAGIKLKTKYDANATRYALQHCSKCGYSTIVSGDSLKDCPKCETTGSMRGVDLGSAVGKPFTEIVEPAGFTTGFGSKVNRVVKSKNSFNFIQPVLLEMEDWPARKTMPKILMRTSTSQSEILFYNSGEQGMGYAFCPYCGRMESEKSHIESPLINHKHLNTGAACDGGKNDGNRIRRNVLLIGRYQTDFIEIKFFDKHNKPITDTSTLYSLGVVLSRKLIEVLGIEEGEVDFGYNKAHDSIFIYDTALGGAGYSPLLREYKDEVLRLAYKSLAECNCELACTRCLIDRRSQWYLNSLDRNKALEWLEMEQASRIIPTHISQIVPRARTITTDFNSEFFQIVKQRELKSVRFFISNDVENWNPDKFAFRGTLRELNLANIDTTFVMSEGINLNAMSADTMASIIPPLLMTPIEIGSIKLGEGIYPVMLATFTGGRSILYFTDNANISYNHNWSDGNIYAIEYNAICHLERIDTRGIINQIATYSNNIMFDARIKSNASTGTLLEELIGTNPQSWDRISKRLHNKEVKIRYADRYLVTPLGCMLLAQLIKQLQTLYNLSIVEVECAVISPKLTYATNTNIELTMNFINEEERNQFLSKCILEITGIEPNISRPQYAQHDRCLSVDAGDCQLCIRPDGGVAHGWATFGREKIHISDIINHLGGDISLFNKESRNERDGILYTIALK